MHSLIIVSHPGHELRLHHWMEIERPEVFVLTDGSGSSQQSRLPSTERLVKNAGATLVDGSGRHSDAAMYAALRNGDLAFFRSIFEFICNLISQHNVDTVVCDAIEGYNTSHDLCHQLVLAAVRAQKRPVNIRDFLLAGSPSAMPPGICTLHRLDEPALERKLDAAMNYPELAAEVQMAVAKFGRDAFRTEILRHVEMPAAAPPPPELPPFYETYGEKRMREGVYPMVIRYETHVAPLSEAIWKWSESA